MTGQAMWAFVIVAVVAAALIGFLLGRTNGNGAKQKLKELEEDLQGKDRELAGYKREVDAHFDRTASLFVSMAGSYKALFEHLSEGYAKLSDGSDRDLFRERVATLLIDAPKDGATGGDDISRARDEEATPEQRAEAAAAPDADDTARDEAEAVQLQADADEDARAAADAEPEVDEERVSPAEAHGPTGSGQEPPAVDEEPEQPRATGDGSAAEPSDGTGREQDEPAARADEDELRPTSVADAQAVESAHKS